MPAGLGLDLGEQLGGRAVAVHVFLAGAAEVAQGEWLLEGADLVAQRVEVGEG
ncbi:hypothetical protein D3C84_1309670 [compost metagenome]